MLTSRQRQHLKAAAHHTEPAAQIGKNGVTPSNIQHIDTALNDHELVKIRFQAHKEDRETLSRQIAEQTGAEQVDLIGNTLVLYRRSKDPEKQKITLPS